MNEFFTGDLNEKTPADLAADYACDLGFDKAGDYIRRHFDGDSFSPGDIIPITTRNQNLDGQHLDGVSFSRRNVELADGLTLEGVFPEFDASLFHVDLGDAARDMSLHQQFASCRAEFQDHMYDLPLPDSLTFGDMERMDSCQGYAPRGFTWNHNPETGSFDLIPTEVHRTYGHTGGNALW